MTGAGGDTVPLLTALLEAEHAVIYGYGVLGARLEDQARRLALLAYDSHRSRRDQLVALLVEAGGDPEPSEPAYDVTVGSEREALVLAVRLEEELAVRWRDLVGGTDEAALRSLGVAGLSECAVRAAQWRELAGRVPLTVALPGTA